MPDPTAEALATLAGATIHRVESSHSGSGRLSHLHLHLEDGRTLKVVLPFGLHLEVEECPRVLPLAGRLVFKAVRYTDAEAQRYRGYLEGHEMLTAFWRPDTNQEEPWLLVRSAHGGLSYGPEVRCREEAEFREAAALVLTGGL